MSVDSLDRRKFAFLILCHRNFPQVQRLIERMDDSRSICFVHIDAKVRSSERAELKQLIDWISSRDNVELIPRTKVYWGGISLVRATLALLKSAHRNSEIEYFRLLSGEDFLASPVSEVIDWHFASAPQSYMENIPSDKAIPARRATERVRHYHFPEWIEPNFSSWTFRLFEALQEKLGIARVFPKSIKKIYIGSQWWSLHRNCVTWLLKHLERNPEVLRFFSRGCLTDEIFFQTVLMNSPFSSLIKSDSLLYEEWRQGAGHPNYLGEASLNEIKNSRKFFVRKIDEQSCALVQSLEASFVRPA